MSSLVLQVAGERRTLELGARLLIGRAHEADLQLDLDAVSREHAVVEHTPDGFAVTDLGSRNGTLVNGRRIDAPTPLRDGDVIRISSAELTLRGDAAPPSPEVTLIDTAPVPATSMTALDASRDGPDPGSLSPEAALRAVRRVSDLLTRRLTLEELLTEVLGAVFEFCGQAESAVVMLVDDGGRLTPAASRARHGVGPIPVSRTVLERVVAQKQAILSTDATADARFDASASLMNLPIRSLMCAPMMSRSDDVLGVIEVHSAGPATCFTPDALDLLLSIAGTTAVAVENTRLRDRLMDQARLERDLSHAREIQRSFLPPRPPAESGYGFFAHYEGAYTVSGDYYAFVELPDGRLAIGIADVSGKGMSAALMMARLSSEVRFALSRSDDPAEVLATVDDALAASGVEGRFVTMVLMVLDRRTQRLRVANAGHPPPLLRRADGSVEPIRAGRDGLPLNVTTDPALRATSVTLELEPGAVVLAYTDGISEATDETGEQFGEARILASLRDAAGGAEAAGEQLIAAVAAFTAGCRQRDDTTVVCLGPRG